MTFNQSKKKWKKCISQPKVRYPHTLSQTKSPYGTGRKDTMSKKKPTPPLEQLHNTWRTMHLPNFTPSFPKKNPPSWKGMEIEDKEWTKERSLKKKWTPGRQFPKKEQIYHISLEMMDRMVEELNIKGTAPNISPDQQR
ncbi:hypothetical protein Salat_1435100 [Sesamum alatum]|uniref:Uncharacterized protein n=1 Tax=Sesamum alatum TaxID=300844 RepID=A0AAE2CLU1_9LAMI|nr:hypothetical protein Salat_1435100 [Sesamum alatum]